MKKALVLGCVLGVLAMVAGSAQAAIIPNSDLSLSIVGGQASLVNTTGSAVDFDAYEIWSDGDQLTPGTWDSIYDQWLAETMFVMGELGSGAGGFVEVPDTPHAGFFGEVNLNKGTLQAYASFAIGSVAPGVGDLRFYWHSPSQTGDKFQGDVIPEPMTLSLLALGGLAVLRRRCRS